MPFPYWIQWFSKKMTYCFNCSGRGDKDLENILNILTLMNRIRKVKRR